MRSAVIGPIVLRIILVIGNLSVRFIQSFLAVTEPHAYFIGPSECAKNSSHSISITETHQYKQYIDFQLLVLNSEDTVIKRELMGP